MHARLPTQFPAHCVAGFQFVVVSGSNSSEALGSPAAPGQNARDVARPDANQQVLNVKLKIEELRSNRHRNVSVSLNGKTSATQLDRKLGSAVFDKPA
jgi:hypothetical protein